MNWKQPQLNADYNYVKGTAARIKLRIGDTFHEAGMVRIWTVIDLGELITARDAYGTEMRISYGNLERGCYPVDDGEAEGDWMTWKNERLDLGNHKAPAESVDVADMEKRLSYVELVLKSLIERGTESEDTGVVASLPIVAANSQWTENTQTPGDPVIWIIETIVIDDHGVTHIYLQQEHEMRLRCIPLAMLYKDFTRR